MCELLRQGITRQSTLTLRDKASVALVTSTLGIYQPSTAIVCKNISGETVMPIRLDWLCKDDFIRGIYKLWARLKYDTTHNDNLK